MFKIPKILVDMLFSHIEKALEKMPNSGVIKQAGGNKLTREAVSKYWDLKDYHRKCKNRRTFDALKSEGAKTLVGADFKPLFKYLLQKHPGLEFLQQTPEF